MEDLTNYELKNCLACDGRGWRYKTDLSGNNMKSECKICLGMKQLYYSESNIVNMKKFIELRELKFKKLYDSK